MIDFEAMAGIVPPGECAGCVVDHIDVKPTMRMFMRRDEYTPEGRYCRLRVNNQLMMTDTQMEKDSNWTFVHKACGEVLVAGLGIGMVLVPVLKKTEVQNVLVVEKHRGVIELVEPAIRKHVKRYAKKLQVVQADILDWKPPPGKLWTTIYFDIWADICTDNLEQVTRLKRKFARRLNRDDFRAWMGAWQEHKLRRRREQERRGSCYGW